LVDTGAQHLLEQLAVAADRLSTHVGRPLSLIAESDLNDPTLITPPESGGYGLRAEVYAVARREPPHAIVDLAIVGRSWVGTRPLLVITVRGTRQVLFRPRKTFPSVDR
jgi:hypothetical protein